MAACAVVPLAFTSPEQPLEKTATELMISALTTHTQPLRPFLTIVTLSVPGQLISWGGGEGGPAEISALLPELSVKDKKKLLPLLLVLRAVLVQGCTHSRHSGHTDRRPGARLAGRTSGEECTEQFSLLWQSFSFFR